MAADEKLILVGVVTGPHGVGGAVRLKSFTARPEDIGGYGLLSDEAGRHYRLRIVGAGKGVLLARLAGVDDRNAAERIKGLRLHLPRSALPPAAEDEFYHVDLIGLAVVTGDGTTVGRVRAIHDFGAGVALEIEREAAPPAMVPFTRAVVPVVDLGAGLVVIAPPPGLFDGARPPRRPRMSPGRSTTGEAVPHPEPPAPGSALRAARGSTPRPCRGTRRLQSITREPMPHPEPAAERPSRRRHGVDPGVGEVLRSSTGREA